MKYHHMLYALALLAPLGAEARPVSYPGGWTGMVSRDADRDDLVLHYSPTARYAVGYRAEYDRTDNSTMHSLFSNYLLRRWNNPQSQGNIYLHGGVGVLNHEDNTTGAGFYGLQADWETRQVFTSYENTVRYKGDNPAFTQAARVGFSPVLTGYNEVAPWLMLEVKHEPEASDPVTVTPLLRLMYKTTMFEVGASDQGDVMLHLMQRF
jgi:hypothetical protein